MGKKVIVIIIAILAIGAFVFISWSHLKKNTEFLPTSLPTEKSLNNAAVPADFSQPASKENPQYVPAPDSGEKKEIEGNMLGISDKNIFIEKTGGSEVLNIKPDTPVTKGGKKSGLYDLKTGDKLKVKYDDGSKNVVSIEIK
jgi:hypothetical protein